MHLDVATLGAVSILLSLLMGSLLLFAWLQNLSTTALCWWGGGFVLSSIGVGVLGLQNLAPHEAKEALSIGHALVITGIACKYSGCRSFNGRPSQPFYAVAGGLCWLIIWPYLQADALMQSILVSILAGLYYFGSVWELLRYAPSRLASQYATAFVYSLAGAACFSRGAIGPMLGEGIWANVLARGWSAEWALLVLLYIPTIAFLLLSMAKERLEYISRQASLTDPLTLLPNRRAFIDNAKALCASHPPKLLSCLFFDIDHFKWVNDTYGHYIGDKLLQIFATELRKLIPLNPVGRIGGEEFAALLDLSPSDAEKLANQIRRHFSERIRVAGLTEQAEVTVSIGCASGCGQPLDVLLARADEALYQAKAQGRNRVACYSQDLGAHTGENSVVPFRAIELRTSRPSLPHA